MVKVGKWIAKHRILMLIIGFLLIIQQKSNDQHQNPVLGNPFANFNHFHSSPLIHF